MCVCLFSKAQWATPIHFTNDNGLNSQIVFSCAEDKNGFVWFTGEHGPMRYNGLSWDYFKAQEGFNAGASIHFAVDEQNIIFTISVTGRLLLYQYGRWFSLEELFPNDVIAKIIINPYNMRTCQNGIVINENRNVYLVYFHNNKWQYKKFENALEVQDQFILRIEISNNELICYTDNKVLKLPVKELPLKQYKSNISYTWDREDNVYFVEKKAYKVNIRNVETRCVVEYRNYLFVASKSGVFKYKKINDTTFDSQYESIINIPSAFLLIDSRENMWICSQFDGVYLYPKVMGNYNQTNFIEGDNFLRIIQKDKNYLGLTYYGKLFEINHKSFKKIADYHANSYDIIYNKNLFVLTNTHLIVDGVQKAASWAKCMTVDGKSNTIYIGSGDAVYSYNSKMNQLYNTRIANRIYGIAVYNKDTLLLGTEGGAYLFINGKMYPFNLGSYSNLKNISTVENVGMGIYSLLIKTAGVILTNNKKIVLLKEKDAILSEPTCIFSPRPGIILIGSRAGLNVIQYNINTLEINFNRALTNTNGLLFKKVSNISFNQSKDSIIITYDKAMQLISVREIMQQSTANKIYLQLIQTNNNSYVDFSKSLKLGHSENSVEISFSAIDYSGESKQGFVYRLLGASNEWTNLNSNIVRFQDLKPGKYVFQINFKNNTNHKENFEYTFEIIPAFWQTSWFLLLSILIAILIIWLAIKMYLKRTKTKIETKNRLETNIANLQLEVQKSTLKPHFIFNCLNAIQYFIKNNDIKKADESLVNFSLLMRQSLELSANDNTTVEKELEFTLRYIELEKQRFGDLFSTEIQIDPQFNSQIIPSLILQTFAENAINHGLRYKTDQNGILKLMVLPIPLGFTIVIEDNGIGIDKATKFKKSSHISKGISIIKERLLAFNIKYKTDIQLIMEPSNAQAIDKGLRISITVNYSRK